MRFTRVFVVAVVALATLWQSAPTGAVPLSPSTRPGVWRNGVWYLRNTLDSGTANISFLFGNSTGDVPMMCDWDGDGVKTPGVFRDGHWFITNTIPPTTVTDFGYGDPGDFPLCGDWDGNGTDTPGVARDVQGVGEWFLSNSLGGVADQTLFYADPDTDYPLVGDWDGNGTDTPGVMRNTGQWFLRNENTSGAADVTPFNYGDPNTDFPIAGDWNNDGTTTVGVVRITTGQWLVRNSNTDGNSDVGFVFGDPLDFPLVWGAT